MADWRRVLDILNLPDEPAVLVGAPRGDSAVVQSLLEVRPSARITILGVVLPDTAQWGSAPVVAPGELSSAVATGSVDAILLDHAMDDIVIDALSRHEGLGPRQSGRGEYSPWARALRAYWRTGDLEEVAAPFFVGLMKDCQSALRRCGKIVIHHRIVGSDLIAGQPMDLYAEYIQLARRWVKAPSLLLREAPLDSFDPQWWLCLESES